MCAGKMTVSGLSRSAPDPATRARLENDKKIQENDKNDKQLKPKMNIYSATL